MSEDSILIEETLAGDKDAYGVLVNKYKNEIVKAAYRFCGNFKDAEDIAQEVFIKAYTNLNKFKKESTFSTWLYRITHNTACNYIRERQKKPLSYETFKSEDIDSSKYLADKGSNPADKVVKTEEKEMIQKAIDKLPFKLKSVIIFREYEGLSYREIAKILSCSIGTVESRIARARERLKALLRPYILQGEKS